MPLFARLLATAWHAGGNGSSPLGSIRIFASYTIFIISDKSISGCILGIMVYLQHKQMGKEILLDVDEESKMLSLLLYKDCELVFLCAYRIKTNLYPPLRQKDKLYDLKL